MNEKIAVVGAGAVGCYFGGVLARSGMDVTLIGRAQHVEVWRRDGLFLDSAQFQGYIPVQASTSLDAVTDASLVLVCVKTLDLENTAAAIAPLLTKDALVLCMQNGVDHAERFIAASGRSAIPAVVYVGVGMDGPGRVKHHGRGDLVIGSAPQPDLDRAAELLNRGGVPCRISDNLPGELWVKLIMNCAYNAQSALTAANYGRIVANEYTRAVLIESVNECIAVARACGITLPNPDPVATALNLASGMAQQHSSTAQDVARGKKTEIDSLNGYVVRRGAEVGVPTPMNQTLHALVKLREEGFE